MNQTSPIQAFGRRFVALQHVLVALSAGFLAACADSESVPQSDSAAATTTAAAEVPVDAVLPGARATSVSAGGASAAPATAASGVSVSREQFKSLRWINGSWAGNTKSKIPYYQSFEVVNDTLITMNSYADAGFSAVSETGVIVMTGGHVYYGPPTAAWIATKWDGSTIEFTPLTAASNAFRWERASDDEMRVTIIPGNGGAEQTSTHVMSRRSK